MEVKETWTVPINKLMYWRGGSWVKYEIKTTCLILRLHCDQLLLIDNNKLLETLNMNGKMKGIHKEDVLILIVYSNSQEIRKFKFQIKSNPKQHFQKLSEHFLVVSHNSASQNSNMQYRKVEDVFNKVLENYSDNVGASHIPADFKCFVKLCLLDPAFPQIVNEAQQIIQTHLFKKT